MEGVVGNGSGAKVTTKWNMWLVTNGTFNKCQIIGVVTVKQKGVNCQIEGVLTVRGGNCHLSGKENLQKKGDNC